MYSRQSIQDLIKLLAELQGRASVVSDIRLRPADREDFPDPTFAEEVSQLRQLATRLELGLSGWITDYTLMTVHDSDRALYEAAALQSAYYLLDYLGPRIAQAGEKPQAVPNIKVWSQSSRFLRERTTAMTKAFTALLSRLPEA